MLFQLSILSENSVSFGMTLGGIVILVWNFKETLDGDIQGYKQTTEKLVF